MTRTASQGIADQVGAILPYLRRYARALTGSQSGGDMYAAATLEAILSDPTQLQMARNTRVSLFKVFNGIWTSSGAPLSGLETGPMAQAQKHLSRLTGNTREALLLHTIEEFSVEDVAEILTISSKEAQELIDIAFREMGEAISGRVMIIEDEAIISEDLAAIVTEMGHSPTGVATTESRAMDLFKQEKPDLILSDIKLADGSSGIDAVNRILAQSPDLPTIFITAYPEELLTGESPEPAFLIPKPYTEEQVRAAVSQAMFFSSTETLKV